MATKPSLRLAHAVLLFLLFLLPTMWLVGAAEGVSGRPTFVFWLVLLLPLFILPWLLSCCAPEETTDGHEIVARQLPHDSTIAERFASLVAPEIDVRLSPVAYAGWIGLFVTALNLMPVGQLDGGHIAYGLFGRRYARAIGIGSVVVMLGLGFVVWPGLLTWALLTALIAGFSHMPALDDVTPPDGRRFALILLPVPAAVRLMNLDSPYQ